MPNWRNSQLIWMMTFINILMNSQIICESQSFFCFLNFFLYWFFLLFLSFFLFLLCLLNLFGICRCRFTTFFVTLLFFIIIIIFILIIFVLIIIVILLLIILAFVRIFSRSCLLTLNSFTLAFLGNNTSQ